MKRYSVQKGLLFNKLMQQNKIATAFNPLVDYVIFDHVNQVKTMKGSSQKLCADSNKLLFRSRAEMVYKWNESDVKFNISIDYVIVKKQSLALTIIELDSMVKCFENNSFSLISAESIVSPLHDNMLGKVAKELGGDLSDHIVVTTYPCEQIRLALEQS